MDAANIPAEELALEAEVSKEAREEEVRANIIAEFGFDEVDDAERINKAVTREMQHREKLSTAIGQKIKYREAAKIAKPTDTNTPPATPPKNPDEGKDVRAIIREEQNARDLAQMPHSEELKKEIKRVAEIRGVDVIEAARDPYIMSRIESEKQAREAEEATTTGNKNRQRGTKKAYTTTPPDVDMATEEGRKEYDNWKAWMRSQENTQ